MADAEDIVEHWVDRERFGADTDFIIDNVKKADEALDAFIRKLKNLPGAGGGSPASAGGASGGGSKGGNGGGDTSAQELGIKANARLMESVKAVNKVITERFASEAKLATLQTDYTRETIKNKLAIADQTKEIKLQAAVDLAANNSREKATAIRAKLYNQQGKLNLANKEDAERSLVLIERIDKLNKFIDKNSDALTRQKINIGNYQGSAKIIVEALDKQIEKQKELQALRTNVQNAGSTFKPSDSGQRGAIGFNASLQNRGLDQMISKAANATEAIEILDKEIAKGTETTTALQRVTANPQFLNVAGKVGDATAEIKFFTKAIVDLERQGKENDATTVALRKHLAELTDQVGDAKAEIKALSSDTRGFDLFAGSVSFLADTFQAVAGAAALAGASEEDTAEITKNLVAVQSLANGVKGVANELTTRGTAANKLFAFSQKQLALITDSSASSFTRFKAALISTGIGVLIVLIGYLIANFKEIKNALTGTTKAQEVYNETLEDFKKGVQDATEKVNKVGAAFENARAGVISKKEALFEYNKELGDSLGKTTDLAEAERLYAEKADVYIKIQGLKAQANALFAKSAEQTAKSVTAAQEDQVGFFSKIKAGLQFNLGNAADGVKTLSDAQFEGIKDARKESDDLAKSLDVLATDLLKQAGELGKAFNITTNTDFAKDEEKKKKEALDKQKKALEDFLKKQIDLEKRNAAASKQIAVEAANDKIRINQSIVDNPDNEVGAQLNALTVISNRKKTLAALDYADAIRAEKEVKDGKIVINKKTQSELEAASVAYNNKIRAIDAETAQQSIDVRKNNVEKLRAQYEKDAKLQLDEVDKTFESLRDKNKDEYNKQIEALNKRFDEGKISQEKYELERQKIETTYHIASLVNEVEYQKQLLKLSTLSPEAKAEALRKLSDLEKELSDASVELTKANEKKKLDAVVDTFEKIKSTASDVFGVIGGLIDANNTAEKNRLKEQGDEAEKKANRDIEIVTASQDTEEKKAAKIALINQRLAIQKAQIAEREKQADLQKARFEKAQAIFGIIINTALAVVKAGVITPTAILAGILGAAQLAIAIATPIPKFFRGKDKNNKYQGWGTMNEYRQEIIEHPDGSIEMPYGRNVLKYIGRDDIIHPDANEFMRKQAIQDVSNVSVYVKPEAHQRDNSGAIIGAIDRQGRTLERIANKKELHLNSSAGGLEAMWRTGRNYLNWLDEQTQYWN